jgi:hypothetical protein
MPHIKKATGLSLEDWDCINQSVYKPNSLNKMIQSINAR